MASETIRLKGITWDHSRGFTSIVAASQRFHELNPHIEISWEKRSLQAFADEPVDILAAKYDLLVIDHPWTGFASRGGVIVPLDDHLPSDFLNDLATNSVGKSHESYSFEDHQYALAIDAATPVAASRPDLFSKLELELPKSWDDLLMLAKKGRVVMPGVFQDTLVNFYMLCSTLGEDVCMGEDCVVSDEIGLLALNMLRDLGQLIPRECYDMNPISVYEMMTRTDDYLYSPFAFGYSNYSRNGYARKRLKFHDLVALDNHPLITTLGGTGLCISSGCQHKSHAARFSQFVASEETQKTLYFDGGGQPGHRKAWLDSYTNKNSLDFFIDTLPALDRAFLRPRNAGHMYFQDNAGQPIRTYMMHGGDASELLGKLNRLYRASLSHDRLT